MKKLLLLCLSFVLGLTIILNSPITASAKEVGLVDCLVCNPGEDSSTSLRFTFNSSEKKATFYYTVESDPEFKQAKGMILYGVLDNTTFPFMDSDTLNPVSYYNFDTELTDLTPGTTYLYRVKAGGTFSSTHKASTSEYDGTFSFVWVSDSHAHGSYTKRHTYTCQMMEQAESKWGEAALIVSSGDSTSYGSYYDNWCQWTDDYAKGNHIWACTPGNHDYYTRCSGGSKMFGQASDADQKYFNGIGVEYKYKSIFWEANNNMPENGIEGYESNYYFLYNSVLFIALDSILQSSGSMHKEIQAWFEQVMTKMQGQYQYIVVYQHYPMFDGEKAEPDKYGHCGFSEWNKIFDKWGVDLVLSGDSHVYLRSYSLKDGKVDSTGMGTTYVNAPQVGDRYRYIEGNESPELIAVRYSSYGSANGASYNATDYLKDNSGITYFTVTPNGITGKLVDTTYNVKDEYTVKAKRGLPDTLTEKMEQEEATLLNSFTFVSNADTDGNEYLYYDASRIGYASSVTVKIGSKSYNVDVKSNKLSLGNLDNNRGYTIELSAEYVSGRSDELTIYGSTYPSLGVINALQITKANDVANFNWNAVVTAGVVDKYKIFYEGNEIASCSGSEFSCTANVAPVILGEYTLIAYNSTGDALFATSAIYLQMGDTDGNGVVEVNDMNKIASSLFASETLLLTTNDINQDGIVDYKDIMIIRQYINGSIESLNHTTQKVVFFGFDGNAIKTEFVITGNDATAPNAPAVDGYTFAGWSRNFENVTEPISVYALYQPE